MHPRHTESGGNMFLTVSLVLLGFAVVASAGVFGYLTYLEGVRDSREAELKAEEAKVSESTVEGFIRLRNRLASAQEILDNHVMTSQLFDELELKTLKNVRFTDFSYKSEAEGVIEVQMAGTARTFNALAAQSAAFATEGSRIRRAIFSGISADENGVVTFELTANVDSRLITIPSGVPVMWQDAASAAPASEAATDAATTTP